MSSNWQAGLGTEGLNTVRRRRTKCVFNAAEAHCSAIDRGLEAGPVLSRCLLVPSAAALRVWVSRPWGLTAKWLYQLLRISFVQGIVRMEKVLVCALYQQSMRSRFLIDGTRKNFLQPDGFYVSKLGADGPGASVSHGTRSPLSIRIRVFGYP